MPGMVMLPSESFVQYIACRLGLLNWREKVLSVASFVGAPLILSSVVSTFVVELSSGGVVDS